MLFPYILSDILRLMTIRSFICISHEYSISAKYSTVEISTVLRIFTCCKALQSSVRRCYLQRLCQMCIHARCQTVPHVLIEGVCRLMAIIGMRHASGLFIARMARVAARPSASQRSLRSARYLR